MAHDANLSLFFCVSQLVGQTLPVEMRPGNLLTGKRTDMYYFNALKVSGMYHWDLLDGTIPNVTSFPGRKTHNLSFAACSKLF